jgi:tRNA (cytidine/uridine-2'-O-)-methyltransferase
MLNVVLVYPDIPYNTGNIGRLCLGLDSVLHLVKPLGFKINDKYLKRAGLDYWKEVNCVVHESYEDFLKYAGDARLVFASTKAQISCYDYEYKKGDFLVFGSETKGLPEEIVYNNIDKAVKIPMCGKIRSLNLSNSVAVILYEAYRQNNFFTT